MSKSLQEFLTNTVQPREPLLQRLEEQAALEHIPIIHSEVGQFLHFLIRLHQPKSILEIGTAIGYSTIWMTRAAGPDAQIKTIEINENRAYEAWLNIKEAKVDNQVQSIVGDAVDLIGKLDTKFDLIFIDAAKGQYLTFLEDALKILNPGGLIVADNVLLKGWVANNELLPHRRMRTMVNRMKDYVQLVMNHPELTSSIIPVGDGVAVSLKEVRR
ncbi:MAG: O-methyltransferase [Halanaerobiales bacterium]|nr:O-methyltransferase [Halanaerobiales bacterium]